MRIYAVATAIWLLLPAIAFAQQEIVVTGSRVVAGARGERHAVERPAVILPRRADYVVQDAIVECDTRDRTKRLAELYATLKTMISDAERNPKIELGARSVADQDTREEIIVPLTKANLDSIRAESGSRTDTSRIRLVIKTPVGKNETDEKAALERIGDFADGVRETGRSLVDVNIGFALSIVDPNQYRSEIVRRIAADAKAVSQEIGAGYDVELSGLERQVYWTRTGRVDLSLFVPYGLSVVPKK